jgi:hypothetical protein
MANWQQIDELNDISADLPRFTDALSGLATDLGWISRRWMPTIFPCAVTRTPRRSAGVAVLNNAARCCRKIRSTVDLSACSNWMSRFRGALAFQRG